MTSVQKPTTYGERDKVDISIEDVKEVLNEVVEMVRKTITPEVVKRLLFTRKGTLYATFPSKKVREWAIRKQKKYGLEHDEKDLVTEPLLYAVARRIYKELEFDLGRNPNIGWALTTYFDLKEGIRSILSKKFGVDYLKLEEVLPEDKLNKLVEEAVIKIEKYAEGVASFITKEMTGGISLGALTWYQAMGNPERMIILESDGKTIRKKGEIEFR